MPARSLMRLSHLASCSKRGASLSGILLLTMLTGCSRDLVPPTSTGFRVQRPTATASRPSAAPPANPITELTTPAAPDPDMHQEQAPPPDPEQAIRDRFFSEFPDGAGWLGLGLLPVPVRVTRRQNVLEVWAPGFGARIERAQNQLMYREGNGSPSRLQRIEVIPVTEGTQYDLWMDSGKHITAVFLRDGQTLRWDGKSIRLN